MTDLDVAAIAGAMPIFPLPNAVLLPDELLPLHVFEPRYRALVAHCLDTHRLFGVATLVAGGAGAPPPVHPELGVGRIVRHQPLPDGRSNLLVQHVACARIEAEVSTDTPFRRVRVDVLPPVPDAGYGPSAALRVLALQVAARIGPLGPRERLFELEGRAWTDAMARLFLPGPDARRAYLVAPTGAARRDLVQAALTGWLAESDGVADEA